MSGAMPTSEAEARNSASVTRFDVERGGRGSTTAREKSSLIDAVLDSCAMRFPLSVAEIAGEVRDEWGPCTDADVKHALHTLGRDGQVEMTAEGWVRR